MQLVMYCVTSNIMYVQKLFSAMHMKGFRILVIQFVRNTFTGYYGYHIMCKNFMTLKKIVSKFESTVTKNVGWF